MAPFRCSSLFLLLLVLVSLSSSVVATDDDPSIDDVTSAISTYATGTSNNPIIDALQTLVDETAELLESILDEIIEEIEELIFYPDAELDHAYGHSPAVYPTPEGTGDSGGWASAYASAAALVAQMTIEELASITFGISDTAGCSGFTGSVPSLNFNGMCLNDAESGVRTASHVSGYPAQIHVGASWNRTLAGARAVAIGKEFKAKGVNVALGPVVGPLGRMAKGGRNWEGFSNDPYLAGELVAPTVAGIQESVIACVKHFIGYEQESNRNPWLAGVLSGFGNTSVSSVIDDRTIHEAYLWPWYDAVNAGAGSVMCSYNKVNGSYACQNSKTMNGLLKTELGFQGFVVSDWSAQQTGIASNNAGLDLVMPYSMYLDADTLADAVANGSVDASRLEDQATRILASWIRYADFTSTGLDGTEDVDAIDPDGEPIRFQAAVEGHVLVKNVNNTLPLNKPAILNLFGYDAPGGLNTSASDSILWEYGSTNAQHYNDGEDFTGIQYDLLFVEILPAGTAAPECALDGTLLSGGGSGAVTPAYSYSPYDGFVLRAAEDGTTLYTDFTSSAPTVQHPTEPCIVFVNAFSNEASDRTTLADAYSDDLILSVASSCANTIVVLHNAGIRLVDAWIDHDNITAVIYAHVPGQDSGLALTAVMYGDQSPSGRLPYTVARAESDWGPLLSPTLPSDVDGADPFYAVSDFAEGLEIDYKHFIAEDIAPRFAFGFGLTYTDFTYSALSVAVNASADAARVPPDFVLGAVAPQGGLASLYDVLATVSVVVGNVGDVDAQEVAQLYLGIPGSGLPKVLRGFDKALIEAGGEATYEFPLRRRDLSIWDVDEQTWVLPGGDYDVMVGKSVLDIQLNGTLTL